MITPVYEIYLGHIKLRNQEVHIKFWFDNPYATSRIASITNMFLK
jgi:hypothetical protein